MKDITIKFDMNSDFDKELAEAPLDKELHPLVEMLVKEENYKIIDREYNRGLREIIYI